MKVLHTSDLHIGKQLLKLKLNDIHKEFFNFLIETVIENNVDLLLISGDIFDNRTPSSTSQKIFYDFLCELINTTNISDVVIISGNHDSKQVVSLVAPILSNFKIHIITSSNVEDELLILKDKNNNIYAQVLAVPYLSDMDLRNNYDLKKASDIENEIEVELTSHFNKCEELIKEKFDKSLPIIGMAHLFSSGGSLNIEKGDGVRDIYVGKLNALPSKAFPPSLDYLALGHIHKPQIINKDERLTYCGSPIQLGFGEQSNKGVVLIEFDKKSITKTIIKTPIFINLLQAKGNSFEEIVKNICSFQEKLDKPQLDKTTYLEIIYCGKKIDPNLSSKLEEFLLAQDLKYEILSMKIENKNLVLKNTNQVKALSMLTPKEIFNEIVKDSLDKDVISLFDEVMEEIQL